MQNPDKPADQGSLEPQGTIPTPGSDPTQALPPGQWTTPPTMPDSRPTQVLPPDQWAGPPPPMPPGQWAGPPANPNTTRNVLIIVLSSVVLLALCACGLMMYVIEESNRQVNTIFSSISSAL